ncbi:uncharacterized protein LOC144662767 isoform X1 [Oculina patagonica]
MLSNTFYAAFVFVGILFVADAYPGKRQESCAASYLRLGCFNDKHARGLRPMPDMLFTDRDSSSSKFSGIHVDWKNWDTYMKGVVCRCAEKAKAEGYMFFGLQYYGECWASKRIHFQHRRHGRGMYVHEPRAMHIFISCVCWREIKPLRVQCAAVKHLSLKRSLAVITLMSGFPRHSNIAL